MVLSVGLYEYYEIFALEAGKNEKSNLRTTTKKKLKIDELPKFKYLS